MAKARIKAGAIRFDEYGRILIDPALQDSIGGYNLPPWTGGPGGGSGVDVACPTPDAACVPESICADVSCVPESACADVGCVPESACADAGCVPEGACADAGCVPEGICADVNCVPEGACADVGCMPESVCADGKCLDVFCGEKNKSCPTNMECGIPPGDIETEGL